MDLQFGFGDWPLVLDGGLDWENVLLYNIV